MNNQWKRSAVVFLTAVSTLSCIKEPKEEANVPATPQEVQTALAKAWGQSDPLTMTPGDFLFQETEQKIESNTDPFFVLQEGITISKKEETSTDFLYTFLYQSKVIKQNQEGTASTREDHRTVSKPSATTTPAVVNNLNSLEYIKELKLGNVETYADDYQMTLGIERFFGLLSACFKSDSLDQYCKNQLKLESCDIQCSNLKVTEEVTPVPALMKVQPSCGGYANCSINTKKVAFDWTISLKNGQAVEKQKVNYTVSFSPDFPFFARMTEYCYRQLITVQNQKVLVNTCTKLRNYKKADQTASPAPQ
ncbi:MAG: hypothetical protein ACXWRG_06045 [Bdellovibrio sp.]